MLLLPRSALSLRHTCSYVTQTRWASSSPSKPPFRPETCASAYLAEPRYPPLDLTRTGSPRSLDRLRAPQQEYIERPTPDIDGKVSISQRFDYYKRLGSSLLRFYKGGLKKVFVNRKESKSLGYDASSVQLAILYPKLYTSGAPITRADYQLWLQAKSDFRKLIPFAMVLTICGEFTPLLLPFLPKSILPKTCLRDADQMQIMKNYYKRACYGMKVQNSFHTRRSSNPTEDEKKLIIEAGEQKLALYHYLVQSYPWPLMHPYLPFHWRHIMLFGSPLNRFNIRHHEEILLDTILIVREGGFGKLSPQDICDYCIKTGDQRFIHEWLALALHDDRLPVSTAMAATMAPILDDYAKTMLDQDWTRLIPRFRWMVEATTRIGLGRSA